MSEDTIPNMRDQIKALESENSKLRSNNETLETDNRAFAVRNAFVDQGYSPEHAELYASVSQDEATADNINEFVTKYQLSPVSSEESSGETESADGGDESQSSDESVGNLSGMSGGGSGAGSGGADGAGRESMTIQEWKQLSFTDKTAAEEAIRQGRVQVPQDSVSPPGSNPYESLIQK